jgi:flagellar FliL protein
VSEAKPTEGENQPDQKRRGKRRLRLILGLGIPPLMLVGGAYYAARHPGWWPLSFAKPVSQEVRPAFVDLPEMAITLSNGGQPRQMRIKLSLELAAVRPETPPTDVLTPKVYDALLTYFRTLRDGEIEGSLALDRMRGDLYRRLSLVLGPGVLRDVLITSLVVA